MHPRSSAATLSTCSSCGAGAVANQKPCCGPATVWVSLTSLQRQTQKERGMQTFLGLASAVSAGCKPSRAEARLGSIRDMIDGAQACSKHAIDCEAEVPTPQPTARGIATCWELSSRGWTWICRRWPGRLFARRSKIQLQSLPLRLHAGDNACLCWHKEYLLFFYCPTACSTQLQAIIRGINQDHLNQTGSDLRVFIPAKRLVLGQPLHLEPPNAKDRYFKKGAGPSCMQCAVTMFHRKIDTHVPRSGSKVADGEKSGVKAWRMLAARGLRIWLQGDDCHPCWNDTRLSAVTYINQQVNFIPTARTPDC